MEGTQHSHYDRAKRGGRCCFCKHELALVQIRRVEDSVSMKPGPWRDACEQCANRRIESGEWEDE